MKKLLDKVGMFVLKLICGVLTMVVIVMFTATATAIYTHGI